VTDAHRDRQTKKLLYQFRAWACWHAIIKKKRSVERKRLQTRTNGENCYINIARWRCICNLFRSFDTSLVYYYNKKKQAKCQKVTHKTLTWNSHNILPTPEISSFPLSLCHYLATHLSASDSFTTVAHYTRKSITHLIPKSSCNRRLIGSCMGFQIVPISRRWPWITVTVTVYSFFRSSMCTSAYYQNTHREKDSSASVEVSDVQIVAKRMTPNLPVDFKITILFNVNYLC